MDFATGQYPEMCPVGLPFAAAGPANDAAWCGQLFISVHQFAEALGKAVDVRDHYTRTHSVVVAEVAQELAAAMGLPAARCAEVHVAGHLHDLGKIGVPDRVLRARGPLGPAEWREIRRHPELGYEILRHVPLLARPGGIAEMVLHHHERYDGSGYPHGLRQGEIPLGARIVAVADAFSAMVDDRVYRKGLSEDMVFAELARCAGSQFDPEVVAVACRRQAAVCERWRAVTAEAPGPGAVPLPAEEKTQAERIRAF